MSDKDCTCYQREYTKEEQLRIRCGDDGDDDDSDISDRMIARGKTVVCVNCIVRVSPRQAGVASTYSDASRLGEST